MPNEINNSNVNFRLENNYNSTFGIRFLLKLGSYYIIGDLKKKSSRVKS